jgi:hypothetical protein
MRDRNVRAGDDGRMTAPTFRYHEHPRLAERATEGPPSFRKTLKKITATSAVTRFNSKVGLAITRSVGTMWCAYVFAVIGIMGVTAALTGNTSLVLIVGAISGYFLQLFLLPVIIVGQNVQAASSDDRAAATYKDAGAILEEAKQIQAHLAAQDAATTALLDRIQSIEKQIAASR